ncbi:MAG TPA: hypothetical protein VFP27_06215 [Mycobacterium sp.]|nr:hypothetical protein [Mycobacterium sp.]
MTPAHAAVTAERITVVCPACAHPITCTSVAAVFAARDEHERWHLTNPCLPTLTPPGAGDTDAD